MENSCNTIVKEEHLFEVADLFEIKPKIEDASEESTCDVSEPVLTNIHNDIPMKREAIWIEDATPLKKDRVTHDGVINVDGEEVHAKSQNEWTNELIFEFLNLYKNEQPICNSSSPQYKNKNKNYEAWLRIKNNLKDGTIPITELKKKRDNLMSTYRKLKGKIKDSMKTSTDTVYKPEWPFYNTMANFMDGVYKPRITKAIVVISDKSDEDSNEATQNIESNEEQSIAFKGSKLISKRKRKLDETQNRLDEAYSFLKQLSQKPQKDISSMYCDLLAEKLRSLNENTRELAMLEIDKLVYNLKQLENKLQKP